MSGYRPDLHTPAHDKWDQGGYCNNLVTDDDGCGTVCGYRTPRTSPLDTLTLARDYLDSLLADAPAVVNGWLVQDVKKCTCGTPSVAAHGHEPYCGYEPLTDDPLTVALHAAAPAIRAWLDALQWGLVSRSDMAIADALLSTSHAQAWLTDKKATQ